LLKVLRNVSEEPGSAQGPDAALRGEERSRFVALTERPPEAHKLAEVEVRTEEFMRTEAHKPFGWGAEHWSHWATVEQMLRYLGIVPGVGVLDVGCGSGWTTLLLAEAGYRSLGIDLVPANVTLARARAERWESAAEFEQADMDDFELDGRFSAVLVFDALHHSTRQQQVIANVASHLESGGWVIFGEPSWLHWVSPHARRTARDRGWMERGVTARGLRKDCRAAGMGEFRRFFEGTRPYASRGRGFAWQLTRLAAANVAAAPQALIWLAARKPIR
jgi:2-polyprenyl-3-methyl-5-hydroxy-6-metoxy-1,4-benzoquinol methylase